MCLERYFWRRRVWRAQAAVWRSEGRCIRWCAILEFRKFRKPFTVLNIENLTKVRQKVINVRRWSGVCGARDRVSMSHKDTGVCRRVPNYPNILEWYRSRSGKSSPGTHKALSSWKEKYHLSKSFKLLKFQLEFFKARTLCVFRLHVHFGLQSL